MTFNFSYQAIPKRSVSVVRFLFFLRWYFLGWPGFARTTAAARPACWRNNGPRSLSHASTAPFPATPTSTSTYCRLWQTSSTSTAKTWWWQPSPRLTTGTLKRTETWFEPEEVWADGNDLFLSSPLRRLHESTSALRSPFINPVNFETVFFFPPTCPPTHQHCDSMTFANVISMRLWCASRRLVQ